MKHTNQIIFLSALDSLKIRRPQAEYKFCPERRWRFDYCWPDKMLALEVEGGVFTSGRHTRGAGFMGDIEKYNTAAALGYRIIRTVPSELCKTKPFDLIQSILTK